MWKTVSLQKAPSDSVHFIQLRPPNQIGATSCRLRPLGPHSPESLSAPELTISQRLLRGVGAVKKLQIDWGRPLDNHFFRDAFDRDFLAAFFPPDDFLFAEDFPLAADFFLPTAFPLVATLTFFLAADCFFADFLELAFFVLEGFFRTVAVFFVAFFFFPPKAASQPWANFSVDPIRTTLTISSPVSADTD